VQRRRRQAVAGQRGEHQRARAAEQQQRPEVGQRLVARGQRHPNDDHETAALGAHRGGQQPDRRSCARRPRARDRDRAAPGRAQLGAREQWPATHSGSRVEDPAVGGEDLREVAARPGAPRRRRVAQARVGLRHERADVARARAQTAVEAAVEVGAQVQVEEEARGGEHDRHHTREGEREPQPDRGSPQAPPPSVRKR
jgi:hypothetical protein